MWFCNVVLCAGACEREGGVRKAAVPKWKGRPKKTRGKINRIFLACRGLFIYKNITFFVSKPWWFLFQQAKIEPNEIVRQTT